MNVTQEALLAIELGRALFARVAPRFADGSTAELLRANDALQLALAHVVTDASEARPRPIVCARY